MESPDVNKSKGVTETASLIFLSGVKVEDIKSAINRSTSVTIKALAASLVIVSLLGILLYVVISCQSPGLK